MKLYDNVILNEEIPELSQKGIHKNYLGTIAKKNNDICTVCFYNSYNFGEYAFANVNEEHLSFVNRANDKIIAETDNFMLNVKMENYTKLTECDVKEYDIIEVIVEKPKYANKGVHKGMIGVVFETYAVHNSWRIIFDAAGDSKDKIVQININRNDFKIIGSTLLQVLDNVILKEEIEYLAKRGIHKHYRGTIAKIVDDEYTVCFFNPENFDDFAFAKVEEKYLSYDKTKYSEEVQSKLSTFFTTVDMDNYNKLNDSE